MHLSEESGEGEGPVLAIGDAAPDPSLVSDLRSGVVFLSPERCSGGVVFDDPPVAASNCLAEGRVSASIYGDAEFIRAVLDGLRVESFSPASS